MNFRFLRDLQPQPDDSIFSNFGNEIYASFIPSAASQGGNSLVSTVLGLSPIPSFWNQGTSSTVTLTQAAANSGVAVTSGGITINLLFDAAAMAAPKIPNTAPGWNPRAITDGGYSPVRRSCTS